MDGISKGLIMKKTVQKHKYNKNPQMHIYMKKP